MDDDKEGGYVARRGLPPAGGDPSTGHRYSRANPGRAVGLRNPLSSPLAPRYLRPLSQAHRGDPTVASAATGGHLPPTFPPLPLTMPPYFAPPPNPPPSSRGYSAP